MFDAAKLKRLRDEHKLTTKQLADRCGISRGYISQIESGIRQPSIETVTRLSEALGISPFAISNPSPPVNREVVSGADEDKELIEQRLEAEYVSESESETVNHAIPLSALLGFCRGCVEDQHMSILYGQDTRTEVRLGGVTKLWGRDGLHKFSCIAGHLVVQLHIELQSTECCDGLYTLHQFDERNRPDVELELWENRCIKQLTLVWFTSYSSLAERFEFLRKHENQFRLKVWESHLENAWSQAKTLTKMTPPH